MSFKTWIVDFLGIPTQPVTPVDYSYNSQVDTVFYKELAIQTAITLIANGIAKCEMKVYEGNKEVKNQTYFELNVQPNKNQNSSQLWHKAIEKMIYEGECIVVNVGGELFVADSYHVEEYPIKGNIYKGVVIGNLQLNKTFRHDEVIRLRLSDKNIKNLLDGLSKDYEDLLRYSIKKYKGSNQNKYVLALENIKASDAEFQKAYKEVVQKQLKDFMENDNAVYPQFKGYNLKNVTTNRDANTADFKDIRRDMFEIVAQAFQIPLDLMFGDVENIDEIVKVFLTFCIDPIADMISEELTRKIYPGYSSWSKGNYIRVDTSSIQHIDVLDIADKADKLIASGTCCIDEVRNIIGFNALDTVFSQTHFITKNYDTAEHMLTGEGGEITDE